MIALDTSAIVAIIQREVEAARFTAVIVRETAIVGTPTLLETHMVLSNKLDEGVENLFAELLETRRIRPVAFSLNMFEIAQEAFDRYGKGRHSRAALTLGDCMSYAVAKFHNAPLLFKEGDFAHTDIEVALPERSPSSS